MSPLHAVLVYVTRKRRKRSAAGALTMYVVMLIYQLLLIPIIPIAAKPSNNTL
jgi:hypothetical protein